MRTSNLAKKHLHHLQWYQLDTVSDNSSDE